MASDCVAIVHDLLRRMGGGVLVNIIVAAKSVRATSHLSRSQRRKMRAAPRTFARRCLDIAGWIVTGAMFLVERRI